MQKFNDSPALFPVASSSFDSTLEVIIVRDSINLFAWRQACLYLTRSVSEPVERHCRSRRRRRRLAVTASSDSHRRIFLGGRRRDVYMTDWSVRESATQKTTLQNEIDIATKIPSTCTYRTGARWNLTRSSAVAERPRATLRVIEYWSVSLWQDPDDVSHCRILSPDKTEWRPISATLCRWRRCFVADQLCFMTCIREEDWLGHFQTLKTFLFFEILIHLICQRCWDNALYKFTIYLLT